MTPGPKSGSGPLLNVSARIPVCGLVSGYNGVPSRIDDDVHGLLMSLIVKRTRLEGFLNGDHLDAAFAKFEAQVRGWLEAGQLRSYETIVEGLEHAPDAFVGLFEGRNVGKLLVKYTPSG